MRSSERHYISAANQDQAESAGELRGAAGHRHGQRTCRMRGEAAISSEASLALTCGDATQMDANEWYRTPRFGVRIPPTQCARAPIVVSLASVPIILLPSDTDSDVSGLNQT